MQGSNAVHIAVAIKIKGFGVFRFDFLHECNLPATVEAIASIAVEATTTIDVTSTTIATPIVVASLCPCSMGCNYRAAVNRNIGVTTPTNRKKNPSIHYTIVFFYLFTRYNTSLHLLYVQTNSVERTLLIFRAHYWYYSL
jgi:hypothetical protein